MCGASNNSYNETHPKIENMLEQMEQQWVNRLGFLLKKSPNGFTQDELYTICGRNDDVATVTVRKDSESESIYGDSITVCFIYTIKERESLELDPMSLNDNPKIRAKALLPEYDQDKAQLLATQGINICDIVEIIVAPSTMPANLYYSEEKRQPNVLTIPFEADGGGRDIVWMYGALKHFIEDGIALCPEEKAAYLAYKIVLEPQELTDEERDIVFDENGLIHNNDVALKYLSWKEQAKLMKDKDVKYLNELRYNDRKNRIYLLDAALKGVGGLSKFIDKNPEKAFFLVDKVMRFHEHRYNVVGKHLLYMDLASFIHIYLRHVEELKNNQIYSTKTKFQLNEEDVEHVIDHVMTELNDEYQIFKDEHLTWNYQKKKDDFYYYKGDYYGLEVDPSGRLTSFYKADRNKR